MSKPLPSREQAILLLQKTNCHSKIIEHCVDVANLALETADQLSKKGFKLDLRLIEAGSLLHDIGRSKTHTVDHVIAGVEIAKSLDLPEPLIRIIKRHVGGGITKKEAEEFGWPEDDYIPVSLEEKIVSYADKLVENSKRVPIDLTIEQLKAEHKNEAAERVRRLNREITELLEQ